MLGAISHASPPRRPGSLPTRLPPASKRGAAQGVEGALSARLGRKLANEGQKGWGRRNYFFFNVFKTNSSRRVSPTILPAALAPWVPTHPPSKPLPTQIPGLVATARRRNRTSSHVSRVSRGPPRPSPMARPAPGAGPRMRAQGFMRGAGAGEANPGACGPGCGRARMAPGRAFGRLELV